MFSILIVIFIGYWSFSCSHTDTENNWERKWMCYSILVHSGLMFLRLSVSWMLIKQQNTERKITFVALTQICQILFIQWRLCSVILHLMIQFLYLNTVRLENIKHCLFHLYLCSIIFIYACNLFIFYDDLLTYKITPIIFYFLQIELFKSSGDFFFLFLFFSFSISQYISQKNKISQCYFFPVSCSPNLYAIYIAICLLVNTVFQS